MLPNRSLASATFQFWSHSASISITWDTICLEAKLSDIPTKSHRTSAYQMPAIKMSCVSNDSKGIGRQRPSVKVL